MGASVLPVVECFEVSFMLFQRKMLLKLDALTSLLHLLQPEHELIVPNS